MKYIRDTLIFAFLQGFIERFQSANFGRTHETNQDWNEAYDTGMNYAEKFLRVPQ